MLHECMAGRASAHQEGFRHAFEGNKSGHKPMRRLP